MPTTLKEVEEVLAYGSAKILKGLGATESMEELLADRERLYNSIYSISLACRHDEDEETKDT